MSTEEIIVMGNSVLNNPQGWAYDYRGDSNDRIVVQGGEEIFDADDVVVFVTEGITDGELTSSSRVVEIRVYDSAQDYVNDVVQYTYTLENNASYSTGRAVSGDVRAEGDRYFNFGANDYESSDAGAPDLDQILIAPGIDLHDNDQGNGNGQGQGNGNDWIYQESDYDYNGDGSISGDQESGNDSFNIDNNIFAEQEIAAAVCLTRGTLIDTPDGPRFIETLQEGDLVNTLDNGPQEVRWIGSRTMPAIGNLAPVLIKAGALGNVRDMKVSQNHRMMVRGAKAQLLFGERDVLVAAKHLVDDTKIRIVEGGTVDYFHMLFDEHQIIFAECCPTESLYPGQEALKSVSEEAHDEILAVFPELREDTTVTELSRYELKAWEARVLLRAS